MELNLVVDERTESRDGLVKVTLVPESATPLRYLGQWTLHEAAAPAFVRNLRGGQIVRIQVDEASLDQPRLVETADVNEFLAPARRAVNIVDAPFAANEAALDADREASMEGGH